MIVVFDLYTNRRFGTFDGFADGGIKRGANYVTQASDAYGDFHFDATARGLWEGFKPAGTDAGTVTSYNGNVYGWAALP